MRETVMGNTYEDRIRAEERERCAKIAEDMPDRVLVVYSRGPGSPPGNTYVHINGQKLIANAIRKQEVGQLPE